jgi:hypothetical protein
MRLVLDADHRVLGQAAHAPEQELRVAFDRRRSPGQFGIEPFADSVVEWQDPVASGLHQPQALELVELVRVIFRQVTSLAPVGGRVVELPDVVVERRCLLSDQDPRALCLVTAVQPLW